MIESSFLSSSPWDSDPFQDLNLIPDVSSFEMELGWCELDNGDESFKLSGSSSPVSDYDCSLLPGVSDTFVSEILGDGDTFNITGFSDLDWLTQNNTVSECQNQTVCVNDTSPIYNDRAFNSDPFEWILSTTKIWSKMTPSEQLRTLHALSDIVTYHMGIGTQVEVINIIDPTAVILPEDKEFALDSSNLTDSKFRKLKELIKKHRYDSPPESLSSINAEKSSPTKLMCTTQRQKTNFPRTKRKEKKQKVSSAHESHKRQKQNKKELKSGFFVKEVKIRIKKEKEIGAHAREEDEDVNILE